MSTYIHGTEPLEQQRLVELNRLTNEAFLAFADVRPGLRVLDVGSGLGILAARIAAVPGVQVVGVERSPAQIAAATRHLNVHYIQADAQALPVQSGAFDLACARFLLEHVRNPATVLAEMQRALSPGGRVAVIENDISLVRFDPPCPRFDQVWEAFGRLQQDLGGDGFIGRRLFRLLTSAGFEQVELSVQPELHWHGSPKWAAWVTNIIGNVESARDALRDRHYTPVADIDAAVAELRALIPERHASATFVWNRARGRKRSSHGAARR
jgi:SAM-dependent methyltransferase